MTLSVTLRLTPIFNRTARPTSLARSLAAALLIAGLQAAAPAAANAAEPVPVEELPVPAVPYPEDGTGHAEVVLELEISADGSVTSATPRQGREPFARAAREAALSWRFPRASRRRPAGPRQIATLIRFEEPAPVIPALGPTLIADARESDPLPTDELLDPSLLEPEEVVVLADRRSEIGGTFIPQDEARQIPGTFSDPFRVVEVLPGIAPIVSGVPYFFVRGAPPGNVGYFIDGIRVPLLFHVGVGPSVIAPGLVDRVDVIPSAYSAHFGRAAGGIIVGETMGSTGVARGEFQTRAFDSSALLELPLGESRSSLLVAGRYSYVQPILDRVAPDYALGYWDYQARLNVQLNANDVLTVFGFGAADSLESRVLDRQLLDTTFHRLDLRWDHTTARNTTRVALTGSIDRAANAEDDPIDYASELASRGLRLRVSSAQKLGSEVTLRAGGDAGMDRISTERSEAEGGPRVFPARMDLSGSAYVDAIFGATGVEVVPGVRVEAARWRGQHHLLLEPRLASRLQLWRSVAWVSQLGVAHQFPTQSVRIPGQAADPIEQDVQEAWQAAQGLEFGTSSILLGKVSAFHSWIDTSEEGVTGRNYGLELFLRREFASSVGGIVSYTLSRTATRFGNETLPSEFDRTHVLSAVLGWYLGAGVRLGLRGYYATGQRYVVACPTPDCGPGDPTAPRPYIVRGRLPSFYRADLRLEKRWDIGLTGWLAVALEWFNATLSKERTFIDWSPEAGDLVYADRDPLTLPSLGIEGGF